MKKIVGIDNDFGGGDIKGNVGASLSIEGSDLVADVSVKAKYPLAKVVDPAKKAVRVILDKLDRFIPGDQKGIAQELENEFGDLLVKYLSEQA